MKESIKLDTNDYAIIYRDNQIRDLLDILHRWKGSVFTRHLDIEVFDRLLRERNQLHDMLIIAQNTITALTERKRNLEDLAAHFDPEGYAAYRKSVQTPLSGEDRFED
jgi:hypothetical protein